MVGSANDKLKVGLVFPVWVPDLETLGIVKQCFENTQKFCPDVKIEVMIDGPHQDAVVDTFPDATIYEMNSGITRSWNDGADRLFCGHNCDVVILGNQDAYPAKGDDLELLAEMANRFKEVFFAVGPLTNNPGHVPQQMGHGPEATIPGAMTPADGVNGFTWAIARDNWSLAFSKRNHFLLDAYDKIYDYSDRQVKPWNGDRRQSLAMVGQEDELFHWADRELHKKCGIYRGCFWWHYKLALFRRAEHVAG
jgi:hypothetical protein